MPTNINPDNPAATGAGRLQAMVGGPRTPGDPSTAGKPGVQPGRAAIPNPPAPASSPIGKPPDGARKAMTGTQPQQPGNPPAPGAAPTPAATQSSAAPPPTPGSPQPASGAGSTTEGMPAAPTVDANGLPVQTAVSTAIPTPGTVPPGTQVQTPLGTVSGSKPSGLALDVNGQQRYKEATAKLRARFTVPKVLRGMPNLPQMSLKLGASNYDPFSGRFYGRD